MNPARRPPFRRLLAAALFTGLALCAAALPAAAQEITVSAAASLQNAMRDLGGAFELARPGATVRFNFGASGALVSQLANGAPVDVLATADSETMDRADAAQRLAPGSRVDFASTQLVLVSPLPRPATLHMLADLNRADVRRIAVGTPASVPAGRYAQMALEKAGLWTTLMPKLVYADDVRQALSYVSRAEADAAFVYRTDALLDAATVRIDLAVTAAGSVRYPVARIVNSRAPSTAQAFIAFVGSAAGQAVLARHGFGGP
jgi:molybdate transport system substrate-binding protein